MAQFQALVKWRNSTCTASPSARRRCDPPAWPPHAAWRRPRCAPWSRGLHLSTFRVNLSALCGMGGECRGCVGGVQGVSGGVGGVYGVSGVIKGCLRCNLYQKRRRLSCKVDEGKLLPWSRGTRWRGGSRRGSTRTRTRWRRAPPAALARSPRYMARKNKTELSFGNLCILPRIIG